MSTFRITPLIAAAALLIPAHAGATYEVFNEPDFPEPPEDVEEPVPEKWHGQVALGYSANTGNTDNSNLNGRFLLGYETGRWTHVANLVGHRTTDQDETTSERFALVAKSDYALNERAFLFLTAQYDQDRFAGFDRRTSQALGYGRHLVDNDSHKLDIEVGLGARQARLTDGTSENEAILHLAGNYQWLLSETTEFSQSLVIESGKDNTYKEAVTEVRSRLFNGIYSVISFTVKRNDSVPAGREKTDTFTAVQLEYRF